MTDAALASIGSTLKDRRVEKGLSLETAAEATRVQIKYLSALEEEKWEEFPARVYLEGFLKKYADFLGLSSEELLHQLRNRLGQNNRPAFTAPRVVAESIDTPTPWANRLPVLLLVAALLLLGIFYLYRGQQEKPKSPTLNINAMNEELPSSAAVVPSTAPAEAVAPAAPVENTLTLKAQAPVWMRVWLDGTVRFEGTLTGGEQRQWTFDEKIRLRVGNLARVSVDVNGQTAPVATATPGEILWPGKEGTGLIVTPTPVRTAPRSTAPPAPSTSTLGPVAPVSGSTE